MKPAGFERIASLSKVREMTRSMAFSEAALLGEPKMGLHLHKAIDRMMSEFKVASRCALGHKQYLAALA